MNAASQQAMYVVTESAEILQVILYVTAMKGLEQWLQCKYAWVKKP